MSPDPIAPGLDNPQNRNRFSYTLNNPLRYTDPTGFCSESAATEAEIAENTRCGQLAAELGGYGFDVGHLYDWMADQLAGILAAIGDLRATAGWSVAQFQDALGLTADRPITLIRGGDGAGNAAEFRWNNLTGDRSITFFDGAFASMDTLKWATVHELAHVWDHASGSRRSTGMRAVTGSTRALRNFFGKDCNLGIFQFACYTARGTTASEYGKSDSYEDWAESVAAVIYPNFSYFVNRDGVNNWVAAGDFTRRDYVCAQFPSKCSP